MSIEKIMDQYIGDVFGSLIREVATHKAKCIYLESANTALKAENTQLQETLKKASMGETSPTDYIYPDFSAVSKLTSL